MSGAPANISGSAPATSATARRLRSPTNCDGEPVLDVMRVADHADHGSLHGLALTCPPANPERVFQPAERLLEDRARRGEVEAQPGLAARSELRAGAGKDARAVLDPGGDLLGRQAGCRRNRPRRDRWRRAASSGRRAPRPRCARRTGRGSRRDKAAARRARRRRSAKPPRSRSCRSCCRSQGRSP